MMDRPICQYSYLHLNPLISLLPLRLGPALLIDTRVFLPLGSKVLVKTLVIIDIAGVIHHFIAFTFENKIKRPKQAYISCKFNIYESKPKIITFQ
jgi:hypothetical protein